MSGGSRSDVWLRDKGRCRVCGVKVIKSVKREPKRGEVHQLHGRTGDLRHETRGAVLCCLRCHERLTGKVNDRIFIVPTKTFAIQQGEFSDARFRLTFTDLHGRKV